MNCPKCAYLNKPGAVVCNFCQELLGPKRVATRPMQAAVSPATQEPAPPPATLQSTPSHAPILHRRPRPPFPLGMTFAGLLLVAIGTSCSVKQYRRATFPTYPQSLTPQQMLEHRGYGYTRFDRTQILRDQPVYRAPSGFSRTDPRITFETTSPDELATQQAKHLESYVRLRTVPLVQYFTLTEIKRTYDGHGAATEEQLPGFRIFAPVVGSGGAVWAASPWFANEPKAEPFLNAGVYAGTLRPLRTMLGFDYHKLESAYRAGQQSGGKNIPAHAVAIVEGPQPSGNKVWTWYPLGARYDLFVEVPDEEDIDLSYAEGILDEPLSDSARADFDRMLGEQVSTVARLPPGARAIILTKPDDFRRERKLGERYSRFWLSVLGIGLALLAVAGIRMRRE